MRQSIHGVDAPIKTTGEYAMLKSNTAAVTHTS